MSSTPTGTVRDVIVIGSGPSGYTAAIYSARAGLKPLVFEGAVTAGGALMNTTDVENFPGFPDGIMGPALMDKLRSQAERFGAEFVTDDVTRSTSPAPKVVKVGDETYLAKTVILAMGSGYRKLGVARRGGAVRTRRLAGARPATGSSSASRTSSSSAAATARSRRRRS